MRASFLSMVVTAGLISSTSLHATSSTGTLQGTTTTGAALLNGICPVLYDAAAQNELVDLAGIGTDGMQGHYTQANIAPGRYVLFF